jgi:hypothetical protein
LKTAKGVNGKYFFVPRVERIHFRNLGINMCRCMVVTETRLLSERGTLMDARDGAGEEANPLVVEKEHRKGAVNFGARPALNRKASEAEKKHCLALRGKGCIDKKHVCP